MADLLDSRAIMNDFETNEQAAASSGTMQKVGSILNFHTNRQHVVYEWCLTGNYANLSMPKLVVDLPKHIYRPVTVDGFGFSIVTAGSGGTTSVQVIRRPPTGPTVSLFSTQPAIPAASGNNARMIYRVADNTTLVQTGGTTLGVLAVTTLLAGDQLEMNLTSVQSGQPFDLVFRIFGRIS